MRIKYLKQYVLYPGVILGVTLAVLEFMALFLGLLFHKYLSNIFTVIVFLSVFFAIRRYRQQMWGGYMKFGVGFQIGFYVSIISGLLWSIYRYFQYKLNPAVVAEIIRINQENIERSNLNLASTQAMVEITEQVTTPATLAFLNTFIFSMVVGGAILSLFLAFVLKRENKATQINT